jgi:hypothetical protein
MSSSNPYGTSGFHDVLPYKRIVYDRNGRPTGRYESAWKDGMLVNSRAGQDRMNYLRQRQTSSDVPVPGSAPGYARNSGPGHAFPDPKTGQFRGRKSYNALASEIRKKEIDYHTKRRKELEAIFAKEKAEELEQRKIDQKENDTLTKERIKLIEEGDPAMLKAFDEREDVRALRARQRARAEQSYMNSPNLTPQQMAELYKLKVSDPSGELNRAQFGGRAKAVAPRYRGVAQNVPDQTRQKMPMKHKDLGDVTVERTIVRNGKEYVIVVDENNQKHGVLKKTLSPKEPGSRTERLDKATEQLLTGEIPVDPITNMPF